jgi:hypothetical protein
VNDADFLVSQKEYTAVTTYHRMSMLELFHNQALVFSLLLNSETCDQVVPYLSCFSLLAASDLCEPTVYNVGFTLSISSTRRIMYEGYRERMTLEIKKRQTCSDYDSTAVLSVRKCGVSALRFQTKMAMKIKTTMRKGRSGASQPGW